MKKQRIREIIERARAVITARGISYVDLTGQINELLGPENAITYSTVYAWFTMPEPPGSNAESLLALNEWVDKNQTE